MDDDLMTPQEVALVLRCSTKTVVRLAQRGDLPTADHTPGGHRRFRRADVDAYAEGTAARGAA